MSNNKKILIVTQFYYPGVNGGGPIKSITNISKNMSDKMSIFILTSDRDLGKEKQYTNIETNKWIKGSFGESILYINSKKLNFRYIRKIVDEIKPEVIYLNSYFSIKYSLLWVLINSKIKIVIAPRGEFSDGALSIKKIRKKVYIIFSKIFRIHKKIFWHATSLEEKNDILKIYNKSNVDVVKNLTEKYHDFSAYKIRDKEKGKCNFVFISRITKKKNLIYAIELINNVEGATLDIYGNIEDLSYWKKCEKLFINQKEEKIKYCGVLDTKDVCKTFTKYHFFIFPTFGENYGHVIHESLYSGCPVIISNNTPWKHLQEKNVGWDISLDNDDLFIEVIKRCVNMSYEEYKNMSISANNFANSYNDNDNNIKQMIKLFK